MKHRVKHIHFVGIGGVGMCGIAEVLHGLGYTVSGSDMADGATTKRLAAEGVRVFFGHDATYVEGADVVVTSTAVKADNPEVLAARDKRIPVIPRALMLAELMRFKQGIAIAGTHGKTTTTSLTASVLGAAGLDPTFVIGGKLTAAGTNAKLGLGEFLVAEADESDASFLHLTPVMAVVTNIDADHMDTYDHSFDKLKQAFVDFLQRMPFYGRAVLCVDDPNVREIRERVTKPVTTYGLDDSADIYAENVRAAAGQMHFDVVVKNGAITRFPLVLNLPGRHNVLNALSAIAIGLECGASIEAIQKGLSEFAGVGRRFQRYGEVKAQDGGSFTLIDDYGHHPVEMAATLAAVRGAFPDRRLLLAFQPHRYTRTRDLFEDFVKVLSGVDALLLSEVYAAGEAPIVAADGRALARAVRVGGKVEPLFVEDIADMPQAILDAARDGDVVVTMGAGSVGAVPGKVTALAG
ncbi:UDP-N-acetylmuramate--L-alanine ligase [Chromobacterium violaceum]|uniref:UDP-N-acetylmuramate--L-alanine ligase n=2 Tax=Chromobacterium violaceum TaxID=536 RepID=MURC_CHRVO|nr:UDP-N-acetylmuramate--L-alanine ligase [Chromobacterium violaceum]Q7NQ00.1 RecName: Full=UDP-N-acetylmuramate--L-alanine ligase; AltName: Full=UDP-N-acetylmuramoyl-L-alanine synthetase [Chromobacterium violaceum ATCC 12472]AAQ62001.1 UDP-N-acetylmuramate-alanine ligase [Chromobacterium violaceum ATCC 12472]KMN51516.1 UDP-N-acetylmuramate--alanine ligase [Chromobacterium violaceum]KMN86824.1 UDP-N-acetylmuramate--alanine ligase [Chromobacterium violaceum]KMN91876.1 UDP-N-acetylmuramate--alan